MQPAFTLVTKLNLTHSNLPQMKPIEVHFGLDTLISDVKKFCKKKYATKIEFMQLVLQDDNGNNIVTMDEDDKTLDFYVSQQNYTAYTIHVIDSDPNSFTKGDNCVYYAGPTNEGSTFNFLKKTTPKKPESISQPPKTKISDEEYNNKPNTMKKFKEECLKKYQHEEEKLDENYMQSEAEQFTVGARCRLLGSEYLGDIAYVGLVPELKKGYFVGVKLDQPYGNNNGTLEGKTYFDCQNNCGFFVRPNEVKLGNFPVHNDDDEM